VTVYAGGDFLVSEGISRPVKVVETTDRGLAVADIETVETGSKLNPASGELHGLLTVRDTALGGFLDSLDSFVGTLAFEFNKVFASGQGLNGYTDLTSLSRVDSAALPLDAAGLPFDPVNGSFQVMVYDRKTKLTHTTDIPVDLDGIGADTSLSSLAAQLDAIDGISARVTSEGALSIRSDSPDQEFALAHDTSGLLAALGVNIFFTGSTASSLGVNAAIKSDPAKFAASSEGIGADTTNAEALAQFFEKPLDSQNGASISVLYDRLVSGVTQASSVASSMAEGAGVFQQTPQAQKDATSGVSLDEEAIRMMAYQKSFQASARFISVLSDLLDQLVKL
jgi:flagellar hook-associated protein 1